MTFLRTLPLTCIRHSELPCYMMEGFGGAPVESWPVYSFFKQYVQGETEAAQQRFEGWYADQLAKHALVPKAQGGMYQGSLYAAIEKSCGVPFASATDECKRRVIARRVQERFALLEAIRTHGYDPRKAERIEGVEKDGVVYLRGGHHRAAALRALGKETLPGVLVFPYEFLYTVFCFLRRLKNAHV